MSFEIIEAGIGHAGEVARLHSTSWQANYAGILPDHYLQNQVDGERNAYWNAALPAGDYSMVLLAMLDGVPQGFIAVKDGVDDTYDVTVEHLHVLPDAQGRGIGRLLMAEAAGRLMNRGLSSVCLWVFEDNVAAIGFYERLGGVTDAYGTDKFAGGDAKDRRIGWRDLPALKAVCERRLAE